MRRFGYYRTVALVVGISFVTRAVAIWLTRPEFVGWFNHSYYYWVQTRGVLEHGQLPFADLPLLFHLYAGVARLTQLAGLDAHAAIVHASRGLMSIGPALVALPVFVIVRRVFNDRSLRAEAWLLVVVAAFLPLTFVHMPELLQKNVAGLLLLAFLMQTTYSWLRTRRTSSLVAAVVAFVLIALTHLGTLLVSVLYVLALGLAALHEERDRTRLKSFAVLLVGAVSLTVAILSVFDYSALMRVFHYAGSSLPNSLIGNVLIADTAGSALLLSAGIIGPALLAWLLYRAYVLRRRALDASDRVFWLACLLWSWLLVFPLLDLDIMPRLVLFLPLPALVIAAFHFRYGGRRKLQVALASLAAAGVLLMTSGEVINLVMLYPGKDEIHAELRDLRDRYDLTSNDYVLTQYAVNPACNWFLGTRAGLITAFDRKDFGAANRLFVLNLPYSRAAEDVAANHVVTSETERYEVMRRNIPMPAGAEPDGRYKHLQWYELESVPYNWRFDDNGDWIGWSRN
ncbi:MAG: hypothetical protein QNJ07_03040 [Woeseiaceae bacterium]|nr:hypothetical protein [Woeseiaceae bacterium]